MKQIIFVTGNPRKLRDMQAACSEFGIEVVQAEHDIDEIQSHDPHKISLAKADKAYELAGKKGLPVVVNDAFWAILALKGFPGGYMKDVWQWFEPEDFVHLMQDKEDRRICCTETLIYQDGRQTKVFSKEYWGEITGEIRGDKASPSMEQVIFVDGKSIAEHHAAKQTGFKDYIWSDLARWFAEQA